MIVLAWFSLIIYIMSMVVININDIQKGKHPFAIFIAFLIQSCIAWCLIILVLLL